MTFINTVLADAQELFMDGFEKILHEITYPELKIVGRASSARTLKDLLYDVNADLLFMELNFYDEDGLSIIPEIRKEFRNLRICILSGYTDHKFVKEAFQNGADGYYSKYNNLSELEECVAELLKGNTFLASGLEITPRKNGVRNFSSQPFEDRFLLRKKLTKREQEVLEL